MKRIERGREQREEKEREEKEKSGERVEKKAKREKIATRMEDRPFAVSDSIRTFAPKNKANTCGFGRVQDGLHPRAFAELVADVVP